MLATSKKNPVEGPLSIMSTIAYASTLRDGMIDWTSGKEWDKSFIVSGGASSPLRKWNQQFEDGREILDEIVASRTSGHSSIEGFIYFFIGAPIGIMMASKQTGFVQIENLVASSAASSAGRALIETAVRWSERSGFGDKVTLYGLTVAVQLIYMDCGFKFTSLLFDPKRNMVLDPPASEEWEKTDDGWSLKAKIGKAYAVSGLEPRATQAN